MGSDEDIERAARVSYGYGTRKVSQTRGLIRYLRRHMHTTPSEMVELKFHVCMPIFVARQWIRHRTANVNEYSGRYSLMPLLFYTPAGDQFALQSADNKQGRLTTGADEALYRAAAAALGGDSGQRAGADYEWLVGQDVARELARIDLPLSTYTQWYWKIDLHNLIHFLTLRADPHAQYEIRAYAEVMAGMLKRVAPLSYEAWIDYGLAAAPMSRASCRAAPSWRWWPTMMGLAARPAPPSTRGLANLGLSKREWPSWRRSSSPPRCRTSSWTSKPWSPPRRWARRCRRPSRSWNTPRPGRAGGLPAAWRPFGAPGPACPPRALAANVGRTASAPGSEEQPHAPRAPCP
jgi:thymidylate synthase (FAD)